MTRWDVRTRARVEVHDRARPVSVLYRVTVLEDGFRYDGWEFRSLSKLASEITGAASINGVLWM